MKEIPLTQNQIAIVDDVAPPTRRQCLHNVYADLRLRGLGVLVYEKAYCYILNKKDI